MVFPESLQQKETKRKPMAAADDAGPSGSSRAVQQISSGDGKCAAGRTYSAEGGEDAHARFYRRSVAMGRLMHS